MPIIDEYIYRAISTDIPDPFSSLFSIIHFFRQVFRASSRISIELLYVGSSWSFCLCSAITIYIYIYMCVCMCVRERDRQTDRDRERVCVCVCILCISVFIVIYQPLRTSRI